MSGYRRSFPKGTSERMCALMSEARNISELKRAQCIYFRSEHGLLSWLQNQVDTPNVVF